MEESFEGTNPLAPPTPNPIAPGLGALDQAQIVTMATQATIRALQPQFEELKAMLGKKETTTKLITYGNQQVIQLIKMEILNLYINNT